MASPAPTGNDEDEESRGHEANFNEEEWENENEWDSDDELENDDEEVVDLWSEKIEEVYMTVQPIVQQYTLTPEALDGIMERIPTFAPNAGVSEILGSETIMQLLQSLNLVSQSRPGTRTSKSPKDSANALLALLLHRLENSVRECDVNTNHWCILVARVLMPLATALTISNGYVNFDLLDKLYDEQNQVAFKHDIWSNLLKTDEMPLAEDTPCGILQCSYVHEDSHPSCEKVNSFLQRIEHAKSKYPGTVEFLHQASSGLGLSDQDVIGNGVRSGFVGGHNTGGAIGRKKMHATMSKKVYSADQEVNGRFYHSYPDENVKVPDDAKTLGVFQDLKLKLPFAADLRKPQSFSRLLEWVLNGLSHSQPQVSEKIRAGLSRWRWYNRSFEEKCGAFWLYLMEKQYSLLFGCVC